jgi:hypothetical protein
MRKKFKMLCAVEAGAHFEAVQHAPVILQADHDHDHLGATRSDLAQADGSAKGGA